MATQPSHLQALSCLHGAAPEVGSGVGAASVGRQHALPDSPLDRVGDLDSHKHSCRLQPLPSHRSRPVHSLTRPGACCCGGHGAGRAGKREARWRSMRRRYTLSAHRAPGATGVKALRRVLGLFLPAFCCIVTNHKLLRHSHAAPSSRVASPRLAAPSPRLASPRCTLTSPVGCGRTGVTSKCMGDIAD